MDRNSALSVCKQRHFNVTADCRKANINKNFFPKDGRLRLLQVTYEDYTDWSYVLSRIEHLLRIFQKCLIIIENFSVFVFTSVSEQLLFRIQTCLHKSRPFDAFIKLIWNYGEHSSYFIATGTDNKSYIFPKCADTTGLFAALEVEKLNLLSPQVNVCLNDLLKMTPDTLISESKHSKDRLEGSRFENCDKLNPCDLSNSDRVNKSLVLCRSKPCQYCMTYSRKRFIKSVSRRMPKKQISLKRARKVMASRRAKKVMPSRYELVHPVFPLNGEYPQQASSEQDIDGYSAYSFSNGVSIPILSTSGIELRQGEISSISTFSPSNGPNVRQTELTETSDLSGRLNLSLDSTAAALGQSREPRNSVYTSFPQERTNVSNVIFGGQRRAPRYSHYTDETTRRRSFDQWPHLRPSSEQLTSAGFFYTGEEDLVRCFQCGIGLRDFSESDNPLLEHFRYSGNCEYLFDRLGPTRLNQLQETIANQLTGQNDQVLLQNQSGTDQMYPNPCRHPEYRTAEARFASFSRWPPTVMQRPADLVEAGFYYTGVEDHVRCFTCDGGLRKWDPEDDPWTEHCRWFPTCSFARQVKGDEYIRLVQASAELDDDSSCFLVKMFVLMISSPSPQFQTILKEHKQACLEMGFKEDDFNETVEELRKRGNLQPTLDDIVDTVGVVVENRGAASRLKARQNETQEEQNKRLKSLLICMFCEEKKVNALFLPCTHHRLCMDCAAAVDKCPVCGRIVREKIKTYMA